MIIRIKNLRVPVIIGVHEWEKVAPREITLNLKIEFDGSKAAETDSFGDTIDYSGLERGLREFLSARPWELIETIAHMAAEKILHDHALIDAVEVEVDKPYAMRFADSVSVTAAMRRRGS
jgi:FolB domain-containing protein